MWRLVRGHRGRFVLSVVLILAAAAGEVATPFLIGSAIDDFVADSLTGFWVFAAIGGATTALVVARRFHDVRLYAGIYETAGARHSEQEGGISETTARLGMLRAALDFVEHSFPALLTGVVGFVGTLGFLANLAFPVFIGALIATVLVFGFNAFTTRRIDRLGHLYNDEYERQVSVLEHRDRSQTERHIHALDVVAIKLADIKTLNYAVMSVVTGLLVLFALSATAAAGDDAGAMLAIVLYVLEFAIFSVLIPSSWQEYVRLRDIMTRLPLA